MAGYRQYVGGNWDAVSQFQIDYIRRSPKFSSDKTFLDLGCGSLRLGTNLIREMDSGKYIGLDFNKKFVDLGIERELNAALIEEKKPRFIINDTFDLSEIHEQIDIAWCYAVFIHVNDSTMLHAAQNVRDKLKDDGVLYSSFSTYRNPVQPKNDFVYSETNQSAFYRTFEKIEEMYKSIGLSFQLAGNGVSTQMMVKSFKL